MHDFSFVPDFSASKFGTFPTRSDRGSKTNVLEPTWPGLVRLYALKTDFEIQ